MNELLKLGALVLNSRLDGAGKIPMLAIPAGQVGGATAFALTVTGVATELPLAGAVIVTIPFEVEAKAGAVSRSIKTTDFIGPSGLESLVKVDSNAMQVSARPLTLCERNSHETCQQLTGTATANPDARVANLAGDDSEAPRMKSPPATRTK